MNEAALVLEDESLIKDIEPDVVDIAVAATEGFIPNAGMLYELHEEKSEIDADRHWWVQAETVVGYMNIYQYFRDNTALAKAIYCWQFTKKWIIDDKNGEWHWKLNADGTVDTVSDKAGFWKCPYHNGRMCMEIIERFE